MGKQKQLSPEKLSKIKAREAKELERLRKEQAKSKPAGYMAYFVLIITIIYIADEVTSQIGTQMQSVIASQLFAPVFGAEYAVARMSTFGMVTMFAAMFAFLYKPLSDRYGRRLFLIINTLGMGIGMILVGISTNIPVYLLGSCVIMFFIPHDMQAVYIFESTPAEHRGKIYSVVKGLATMGILLIPVLRGIFIPGNDLSGWRNVYLTPAIVAVAIAVFAIFFVRESDAFIENRIRQLTMTEEEKEAAREKKQDVDSRGGLIKALKFIFSHKQLRWLLIANGFVMCGMLITMYYETAMTQGFAQQYMAEGMALEAARAEATGFVTQALLVFPFGSALFQIIQGFFSDKWGRKVATIIMCAASVISFVLFYVGANQAWNAYVVGFFAGAAVGSYWAAGDIMGMMVTESTPTSLRSSAMAVQPMVSGTIFSVFMAAFMVLMNVMGDSKIGPLCLAFCVPCMTIGLIIMWAKVKETKGIDLGNVRGDEFE